MARWLVASIPRGIPGRNLGAMIRMFIKATNRRILFSDFSRTLEIRLEIDLPSSKALNPRF
ncbi:MAG: hypothetical protein NWF08_02135 [Candidatus Bathyarchaeota archaeon]|nr:hypothetical protein [Candidatus Bathyarchaeota archaeon]